MTCWPVPERQLVTLFVSRPPSSTRPARGQLELFDLGNIRAFGTDFVRALWLLPSVESTRLSEGPVPALRRVRELGRLARTRTSRERSILKRAIRLADRLVPGPSN